MSLDVEATLSNDRRKAWWPKSNEWEETRWRTKANWNGRRREKRRDEGSSTRDAILWREEVERVTRKNVRETSIKTNNWRLSGRKYWLKRRTRRSEDRRTSSSNSRWRCDVAMVSVHRRLRRVQRVTKSWKKNNWIRIKSVQVHWLHSDCVNSWKDANSIEIFTCPTLNACWSD